MSSNNSLVSVIIPVYNVAPYIDSCISSVLEQTYGTIEVILVDDGSQDGSGKRCDYWRDKDDRIKVVHKKNAGLNMARFSGFQVAEGDYIMFLDSDDKLHPDAILNTLTIAQQKKLDAVMFQFLEFSDDTEERNVSVASIKTISDIFSSTQDAFRLLITNNYSHFFAMTAWGKLYARKLIENVDWKQSNFRAFEDNFFTPQILNGVHRFAVLHQQLYFYRRNASTGAVLSKTITGNTFNGKPVGYLEYLCLLRDYWQSFLEKHELPLQTELGEFWLGSMLARLRNLSEAHALCQENNSNYIPELVEYLLSRYGRDTSAKQQEINRLTDQVATMEQALLDLKKKEKELQRISSVRGSIKNVFSQVHKCFSKSRD